MQIAAGEFKARCLKLMDQVASTREEIIITKHGKPIARLLPATKAADIPIFGFMKGSIDIQGDIIGPIGEDWNADQ